MFDRKALLIGYGDKPGGETVECLERVQAKKLDESLNIMNLAEVHYILRRRESP
jgi:hypothetical protein